jgi:hypothetical protein
MAGRARARKFEEKMESLLEDFRISYLQIGEFLSYIYENRTTMKHRKRWQQLERWFIESVEKSRFDKKVLKSWLLQGGGEYLFRIYQAELDSLFKTTAFGRFNIHDWSVESPYIATKALQSLGPTVETQAPLLTSFIRALSSSKECVDWRQTDIGAPQLMIISIFGHCRQRNTATNIPNILGLYLLRGGLRRRCIDTLNHFGVIVSYKTLLQKQKELQDQAIMEVRRLGKNPALVTSWDNFEYQDNRRSERVKEPRRFQSITTAIVCLNVTEDIADILRRGRRKERQGLSAREIAEALEAFDQTDTDKASVSPTFVSTDALIHVQVNTFLCHRSLMRVFSKVIEENIYNDTQESPPIMPIVKKLPARQSFSHPLEPIFRNESTNENTAEIIKDIYERQLMYDPHDRIFETHFLRIVGDLKTNNRILSVQNIRLETGNEDSLPYDRLQWIIPNMGLFHLQLNLLRLIHRVHWGPPPTNTSALQDRLDWSSLSWAADALHRTNVQNGQLFYPLEELIIHSYNAQVVGILIRKVRSEEGNRGEFSKKTIEQYLQKCTPDTYIELLTYIKGELCTDPPEMDDQANLDDEWRNHVLFMRHTQTYLLLKWAISHGDIGLLRQALRQCCVIFQSKQASTGNYARDLIRYLHWVDSSATDKVLQDSILSSALINPSGRPDGFIPVDRHLEALNGDIRTHMMDDRSSYSKEAFIRTASLSQPFYQMLKAIVEGRFGTYCSGFHPEKEADNDIFESAVSLSEESLRKKLDRTRLYPAIDLWTEGIKTLPDNISNYNAKRTACWEAAMIEGEEGIEQNAGHRILDVEIDHPDINI